MIRRHVLTVLVALGWAAGAAPAAEKFDDLLPALPPQVNAVVVCDVQALYNSPLGVREKWASQAPLPLPQQLSEVALGARIDPDDFRGGVWEVGAARLKVRLTMDDIARRENGAVDTVAGAPAVLSPRNVYFVELKPWVIGMMTPADRQELAQWVRYVRNYHPVNLTPFLRESVTGLDKQTQFVLAVDLGDAAHPETLRRRLAESKALAGKAADLDRLVKLIASVRGLKLVLRIDDKIHGELTAAFAEPIEALGDVVRRLLVEFLGNRGASVEALEDWQAAAKGNALTLRGELPEAGLRRILTLILPPAPPIDPGEGEAKAPLAAEIRLLATQRYFKTVQAYLEDLKKPSRKTSQDYEKFATWYESFAQKIEQLPVYNVDEDLVKYGREAAYRLRAIGASLRGEHVDVNKLEQSISFAPYVYAGYNGWGRLTPSVYIQSNMAQVHTQQQQAIEQGAQARQQIWDNVQKATDGIRRKMYEKYKVPF